MGKGVGSSWPSLGTLLKQGERATVGDSDLETDSADAPGQFLPDPQVDVRDFCIRCGERIELGLLSFGAIMCATCRAR
jgi:hypothetical protein